jgi:hypothetical protein
MSAIYSLVDTRTRGLLWQAQASLGFGSFNDAESSEGYPDYPKPPSALSPADVMKKMTARTIPRLR